MKKQRNKTTALQALNYLYSAFCEGSPGFYPGELRAVRRNALDIARGVQTALPRRRKENK